MKLFTSPLLLLLVFLLAPTSFAFISGPGSLGPGEHSLIVGTQIERGMVEPNENRASYQDAGIDVYRFKYTHGLENFLGFEIASVFLEYGQFTSSEERVGANLFYEKDQGSYGTFGFSADILHETDRQFGFYIQLSPLRDYNKKKFSNPRLDLYTFGLTSAFNISENLFQKNLIHLGSGDGSEQNSYLAVDSGFGYRLNQFPAVPTSLNASLFIEADTSQRKDASYDASFSPAGTEDRIRAFKFGTVVGVDVSLSQRVSLNLSYLEKLGGYDARSTKIFTLTLGTKF
jgi:hypothetical protein